ncbi:ROK family protein [Nocardioides sp.]|uniref:ROK family protein n=1 Tax=Nocardioides sp. TaxID=35761 RepID=UPI000C89FEAA|nr:ROK family protein [Nocardioides sp.]MAS55755.1 sugar kinase [Pimelobacter sp.]MDE0774677.1 ROK family protein [Nocardioides sp.]
MTALAVTAGGRPGTGPGALLALFRAGPPLTRAEVMTVTGLSRSTVNQRIDLLLQSRMIVDRQPDVVQGRGRGRPAGSFTLNVDRGVLLVCDIGATAMRAAVCDVSGEILHDRSVPTDVTLGPTTVLASTDGLFTDLLALAGRSPDEVLGIALSVPGPVDHEQATVVSPPIMTGWDRFDLRGWFARSYACPLLLEKDATAMAWGEYRSHYPDADTMLMLKLGTGVGAGIIAGGRIHRGADGAAGDIGHTQTFEPGEDGGPVCRCGNTGCVEARAGGWAMIRDLVAEGRDVADVDELVDRIRTADPVAVALARTAGRVLGVALAETVSILNPRVIVVGGQLAEAEEQIFAGLREMVYSRSLPLATRRLELHRSRLDERAGSVGLALLLADHIFDPERIDAALLG